MIRLLIVLIVIALSLKMLSGMLLKDEAGQVSEDAPVAEAYEPYARAQNFSEEEYDEALDAQREDLDKQIDQ